MTAPAEETSSEVSSKPDQEPGKDTEGTITQAQMNKLLAAQKRNIEASFEDLKSKAQQYDALQESVKSDVQRANESAAEFKARADSEAAANAAVKLENLRYKVSAKKGLDPELWDRVTGSTEEEITADVEKLVEKFSAPERKPIGALRSGASTASNADPKERAASALRAQWQNR
jgi:hypothetical protein